MSWRTKPPIHLWIYNHQLIGINDQIDFSISVFKQNGYSVSIGRRPVLTKLNVVIENFSLADRKTFVDFCRKNGKRVAVIMTEHMDFLDNQIFIHGNPIWTENDYMHPHTQAARINHLFECVPYIRAFFVLGDLPKLLNIDQVFLGLDIRWLPFPEIKTIATPENNLPKGELLFTGEDTRYREKIITILKESGFDIIHPERKLSRNKRNKLNISTKLIVNIPQREDWKWLSLMRISAGLHCGRATISLGTQDNSEIAACTYQMNLNTDGWEKRLRAYINDWQSLYYKSIKNYTDMANAFAQAHPFPHDLMTLWSITDRLNKS